MGVAIKLMMQFTQEAIENPNNEVYGWSSRKGMLGIIKKFGYIMIVFATILIDFLIYKIAGYVNFQMPISTFFSCITTTWFILNEALSITENAGRMGARIPPFISNLICVLKERVEKKAEQAIGAIESKDDIDKN